MSVDFARMYPSLTLRQGEAFHCEEMAVGGYNRGLSPATIVGRVMIECEPDLVKHVVLTPMGLTLTVADRSPQWEVTEAAPSPTGPVDITVRERPRRFPPMTLTLVAPYLLADARAGSCPLRWTDIYLCQEGRPDTTYVSARCVRSVVQQAAKEVLSRVW